MTLHDYISGGMELSTRTTVMDKRAGIAAFDSGGKLLLVKRGTPPARGIWTLPMGAVEERESAIEAAVREALEETGFRVEAHSKLGVFKSNGIELTIFIGEILGGHPQAADDAIDVKLIELDDWRSFYAEFEPEDLSESWAVRLNRRIFECLLLLMREEE